MQQKKIRQLYHLLVIYACDHADLDEENKDKRARIVQKMSQILTI